MNTYMPSINELECDFEILICSLPEREIKTTTLKVGRQPLELQIWWAIWICLQDQFFGRLFSEGQERKTINSAKQFSQNHLLTTRSPTISVINWNTSGRFPAKLHYSRPPYLHQNIKPLLYSDSFFRECCRGETMWAGYSALFCCL